MVSKPVFATAVACVFIRSAVAAAVPRADQPTSSDPEALLKQVKEASTRVDKLNVLVPDPKDPHNLLHNFTTFGEEDTFPALDITQEAMAVGTIGPCALNLPHIHPRATEVFITLDGTIQGGFVLEIGAGMPAGAGPAPPATVNTNLEKYIGTIFPQGSVHWQFNPTCKTATHFAAFDNNDPGFVASGIPMGGMTMSAPTNGTMNGTKAQTKAKRSSGPPMTGSVGPKELPQFRDLLEPQFVQMIEKCAAECGLGSKA